MFQKAFAKEKLSDLVWMVKRFINAGWVQAQGFKNPLKDIIDFLYLHIKFLILNIRTLQMKKWSFLHQWSFKSTEMKTGKRQKPWWCDLCSVYFSFLMWFFVFYLPLFFTWFMVLACTGCCGYWLLIMLLVLLQLAVLSSISLLPPLILISRSFFQIWSACYIRSDEMRHQPKTTYNT